VANTRTTVTAPGRLILGLMVFTITFSLIGTEIEKAQNKPASVNPFTIIFGGTVATSLLTLISHAGEAGERFSVGLATVAFITSALVYGKPVWDAANGAFGSKPTTPLATTTPSTPSTSTVQTATALTAIAG
jgi:hypothetical protein